MAKKLKRQLQDTANKSLKNTQRIAKTQQKMRFCN